MVAERYLLNHEPDSPLYRLLDTKYDLDREDEAISILREHPELAKAEWHGPDEKGTPFVYGSTALHYAANDGKLRLMELLIELGADVNACNAKWYATPISWAANNAHLDAVKLLLAHGADINGANVVHAAAFGGSSCGNNNSEGYVAVLKFLHENDANINSRVFRDNLTPLSLALESGNVAAIEYLRSIGAEE